jgi:hypothetical protein
VASTGETTSFDRFEHEDVLSPWESALGLGFGLWMVVGLFLDGWAHDDARPESFFTPWHAVLYSGFAATAIAAVSVVVRRRTAGRTVSEAIPPGHAVTLVGLGVFALGGVGDLLWHEVLGIEVGVEALLSPSHLVLLAGGVLVLSAPLRAGIAAGPDDHRLGVVVPIVLDLVLLVGVGGFFLAYLSPFVNDAASQRFDPQRIPHEHPSSDVDELQQLLGVGSILVTTVLLVLALVYLVHRWSPPPGSVTLLVGGSVLLLTMIDQFDEWFVVLAGVAAGATIDSLWRRVGASTAIGVGLAVLWAGYFVTHGLVGDPVGWSAELVGGSVVLSGLLAAALSAVTTPAMDKPTNCSSNSTTN